MENTISVSNSRPIRDNIFSPRPIVCEEVGANEPPRCRQVRDAYDMFPAILVGAWLLILLLWMAAGAVNEWVDKNRY